jgi:hypothetical protein
MLSTRLPLVAALLVVLAGCTAERSVLKGDAMCQRTAGSDGGCTAVPSSDSYKVEKERIKENRTGQ